MKVLFVTHCTPMAGANRSMLQLILELRDNYGVEPFVLLPVYYGQNRSLKDNLIDNGIPYKESFIRFFKKTDHSVYTRWDTIVSYRRINRLAKELRPYKFDLVHSNSSVIDFGGFLSRELGVKHIWHLRDFGDLDYSLTSIFGKDYERLTYHNAEGFIAISNCIKNHFNKTIDPAKIKTIYNGVKPPPNVPLSSHQNTVIQFLCAGVYSEAKNQLEILQATDILVNECKLNNFHVTTVGIGVDGKYAQMLKKYAVDHSIEQYVSILGEVDGIAELASTMDVGIMPSHNEAFGRVTVEYMLQNLAVIANDSGANTEIVEHGKSGLIYPHDDYLALAENMRQLILDNTGLESIAANGLQRANECFLSSFNTKVVYAFYQEVFLNRAFAYNKSVNWACKIVLFLYGIYSYIGVKQYVLRARVYAGFRWYSAAFGNKIG